MATGIPTIVRTESELGWWEIASGVVPRHLRPYARTFTGFRLATLPLRTYEVPTGSLWLIVSFGDPLDVLPSPDGARPGGRFVSFAVGLQDSMAVTEHAGWQHGVQVELTPLGARAILGVAPGDLANTCVELDDLLGADAERLAAGLAEAPDWATRLSLVADFLHAAVDRSRVPALAPEVARACRRLHESRGRVAIADVVREVGWSSRHLAARFREQIGLRPKTMARILRFQHAVALVAEPGDRSWADIAAVCGYYDQAHLIREFRALARRTPTEFAVGRLPDLQSPAEPLADGRGF